LKEIQPLPALRMPPSTSGKPAHAQPVRSIVAAFAFLKMKKQRTMKIIIKIFLKFPMNFLN
jgi:hypothetical protein